NQPPVADAGPDQTVYAGVDGLARVWLDGTGSYDPDGDLLQYSWYENSNVLIATGAEPNVVLPVGEHVIDLIVHDGQVSSEPNDVVITVIEPLQGQMKFTPQTLNQKSQGNNVRAVLTLPDGVTADDLDEYEPWRLLPGDIEALLVRTKGNRSQQKVYVRFDRQFVINAWVPSRAEVTIYSKLKSGQTIFGTDTIRVIAPK
ncbi:MAG: hypothetical protein ACYSUK_09950, partial [Planctomycetota bacterium]